MHALSNISDGGRGNRRRQKFLNTIIDFMHLHLNEDLSLPLVASRFEISESSLQRLFKQFTAYTYHQYVEDIRLCHAFDLIYNQGKRIKEAYYASGYRNRTTFNRAFKRKYKYAPGRFPSI